MASPSQADLLEKLRALGISDRSARFALAKWNNNVEQAAEYVFSGQADKDEVRDNTPSPQPSRALDAVLESHISLENKPVDGAEEVYTCLDTVSPPLASRWMFSRRFRRKTASGDYNARSTKRSASGEDTGSEDRHTMAASPSQLKDSELTQNSIISPLSTAPIEHSFEEQSAGLILAALDRRSKGGNSPTPPSGSSTQGRPTAGALAALGLRAAAVGTPTLSPPPVSSPVPVTEPIKTDAPATPNKSLLQPSRPVGGGSTSGARLPRSPSPFFRARRSREERRARDKSPEVTALKKDTAESDVESVGGGPRKFRPQVSAYEDGDESGTEAETEEESEVDTEDDDDYSGQDFFDEETEKNTEANAFFFEGDAGGLSGRPAGATIDDPESMEPDAAVNFDVFGEEVEQDILGEGPNVVVPPEPMFAVPSSQAPRRRKSLKSGLELTTSRPVYARDRCTITLTQGDADEALEKSGKKMRRYVVLSDLSEESRYAVEWAIGTVARDGDEVFLISVMENEDKVDPKVWTSRDQASKLKVQKERQTTALLLVRQVTGLLSRTRLHITVTCQALHAKNARHMLLDLIDFLEPTMVIVGSRGLGKLKGILLGSTSHYLVQKSSVPVMVARRRLQRPLRKTNPANLRHSPRVGLASANIEKTPSSKQEDDVVDVEEVEKAEAPGGETAA